MPTDIPVVNPVAATIVALAGLALTHVPPGVLPAKVTGVLILILPGPTIAGIAGNGDTLTTVLRLHPFVQV